MSEISERLYKCIIDSKYSYGELAKLTEIPKSAIQRYATGETEKIPLDRLEKLASALSVSTSYLMGWEDESGNITGLVQEPAEQWSEIDKSLVRWFRSLPPEKQRAILIAQDAPEDLL